MDRFLYVAMTSAREAQLAQAVTSHNLANASTPGFRATLVGVQHIGLEGPGYAEARAYAVTQTYGIDFSQGPLQATGRDLDVALDGEGWIAMQAPDGSEAYTRAGSLRVDSLGMLTTGGGYPVLGEGGPIALPPYEALEIASDGTLSMRPQGQDAAGLVVAERIRLVNPPPEELRRGEDGLIRMAEGLPPPPAADVRLTSGMLEASNVNVVAGLVEMIQQARAFEMHIRMMSIAEENDQASASLMRVG